MDLDAPQLSRYRPETHPFTSLIPSLPPLLPDLALGSDPAAATRGFPRRRRPASTQGEGAATRGGGDPPGGDPRRQRPSKGATRDPSKACCICTLIILVLVAVGLVFGFGVYTRGFHKLSSNIHLQEHPYSADAGAGRSFRAYGHLASPSPPYY